MWILGRASGVQSTKGIVTSLHSELSQEDNFHHGGHHI